MASSFKRKTDNKVIIQYTITGSGKFSQTSSKFLTNKRIGDKIANELQEWLDRRIIEGHLSVYNPKLYDETELLAYADMKNKIERVLLDSGVIRDKQKEENITVRKVIEKWMADGFPNMKNNNKRSDHSIRTDKSKCNKHILGDIIAECSVYELDTQILQEWIDRRQKIDGVGSAVIKACKRFIMTAINHSKIKNSMIPINDEKSFRINIKKSDSEEKFQQMVCHPDEITAVICKMEYPYKGMVSVLAYTGCRPGEMFAMRKDDIDFEKNIIRFRYSWGSDKTKTGIVRYVAMNDELKIYLKFCVEMSSHETLVFPSLTTKGMYNNNFTADLCKKMRVAAKEAGLTRLVEAGNRFNNYSLRHSYADYMLNVKKLSLGDVSKAMGHASKLTTERYLKGEQAIEHIAPAPSFQSPGSPSSASTDETLTALLN